MVFLRKDTWQVDRNFQQLDMQHLQVQCMFLFLLLHLHRSFLSNTATLPMGRRQIQHIRQPRWLDLRIRSFLDRRIRRGPYHKFCYTLVCYQRIHQLGRPLSIRHIYSRDHSDSRWLDRLRQVFCHLQDRLSKRVNIKFRNSNRNLFL